MSLKLFALIAAIVGIVGIAVGYYLRLIISLGKKGTVEIEIKEMLLKAKEEAKKITLDSESKSIEVMQEMRLEMKEREEKLKKAEDRVIKKEDQIEAREDELNQE